MIYILYYQHHQRFMSDVECCRLGTEAKKETWLHSRTQKFVFYRLHKSTCYHDVQESYVIRKSDSHRYRNEKCTKLLKVEAIKLWNLFWLQVQKYRITYNEGSYRSSWWLLLSPPHYKTMRSQPLQEICTGFMQLRVFSRWQILQSAVFHNRHQISFFVY